MEQGVSKSVMDGPLAPPLTKVIEPLDERNAELPGEVKVDQHGRLLKSYLKYDGLTHFIVEAYDNWIHNILPQQIRTLKVQLPDGEKVWVDPEHIIIENPSITSERGENFLDYPALALESGHSYNARVYIDLVSDRGKRQSRIHFCDIPVMIGSMLDNTIKLSPQEMLEHRFDPDDPRGYFVIKDAEKIIMLQEKLRTHRILLYYDTKKLSVICKMTCFTPKGTTKITSVRLGKRRKTIKVGLNFLTKGKTVPFPLLFTLLGYPDRTAISNLILLFINKEHHRRALLAMESSFLKASQITHLFDYITKKRGATSYPPNKEEYIREVFKEDLFSHIPPERYVVKLYMLAIMVAWMVQYMIGVRDFDDRDNWGNKRLDSGAKALQQLMGGLINNLHEDLKKAIGSDIKDFNGVARRMGRNIITESIITSFSANNWGIKGSYQKENITDFLKRDSRLASYSQVLRINTPISRKTKNPNIREIQQSGLGYICPSETSEGEGCGIIKNLAITTYISVDRDDLIIKNSIKDFVSIEPREDRKQFCIVNGVFMGWCDGPSLARFCRQQRRNHTFPRDVAIVTDKYNYFYIYSDGGRVVRPLLIVDEEDGELVIAKKNLWNAPFDELLRTGCVEYIDAWEQENILIAQTIWDMKAQREKKKELANFLQALKDIYTQHFPEGIEVLREKIELRDNTGLKIPISRKDQVELLITQTEGTLHQLLKRRPYTHCELDPQALYGLSATLMPWPERAPAPRVTYQAGMAKQALSIYHSVHNTRFDTNIKALAFPTRPLVEPVSAEAIGLDQIPSGQTVSLAFGIWEGWNQEDAIIIKRQALERGLFTVVKYTSHKSVAIVTKEYKEKFTIPTPSKGESRERYIHLDSNGLARVGSRVKRGDCIIGKVRIVNATPGTEINESTFVGLGEEGVVERVLLTYNSTKELVAKVKIRSVRNPIDEGDKFAARYSQKGVIGLILDELDMPFSERTGAAPDMIINPHALPSRMTVGFLLELIASKHASLKGERLQIAPFRPIDIDEFRRTLQQYGFNRGGYETMISGTTGQRLKAEIFVGPCFYQVLQHWVSDKIQMRSTGPIKPISRQPIKGRSVGGAIRFGGMETDTLISHGASAVLQERLCYASDAFRKPWCRNCGTIAISDIRTKQFSCRRCGDKANFGMIEVPYSYKLLLDTLNGIGIKVTAKLREVGEDRKPVITDEERDLFTDPGEHPTESSAKPRS